MKRIGRHVLAACGLWTVMSSGTGLLATETLKSGAGSFPFKDASGTEITVWYHAPALIKAGAAVLFVMHGKERNGRQYRDAWGAHAEKVSAILLVPEFPEAAFPRYQYGNVDASSGSADVRRKSAFATIEGIFDRIVKDAGLNARGYLIYGHSAGGQFVHRMALLMPDARFEKAVAANAGWYTMPDFDTQFPYGLKDAPVSRKDAKAALQRKLTVLLGEQDTDETDEDLRKTAEANAQGKHRLERGQAFFKRGKAEAGKLGVSFGWKIETVPGVGHSNSGMAPAAAKALF